MIKRIRFGAASHEVAPKAARPVRAVVCVVLPDLTDPEVATDGLDITWFTDTDHLRRFEDWSGAVSRDPVVVAEEAVLRGADWLDRRWRDGGVKLKHMAVAVRADGLSPEEFSARWRNHAGRVGAGTVIPAAARGLAYVQNHPLLGGRRPYDAVNEVYFDDLDGLRTRVDWFRDNGTASDDLVSRSWFLAMREDVVG